MAIAHDSTANPFSMETTPTTSPILYIDEDMEVEEDVCEIDDDGSETSTITYEHEPFDTYQHKVFALISEQFGLPISDISLDRMRGGADNRVIGVNIQQTPFKFSFDWLKLSLARCLGRPKHSKYSKCGKYIVRIPREADADIGEEVAILNVVLDRVSLPTPEITAYDLSIDNSLGFPYSIQKRLPGQNLAQVWDSLTMAQKCSAAKQVSTLASTIASVQGPPGKLSCNNISRSADAPLEVHKLTVSWNPDETLVLSTEQKAIDHLLDQIERQRANDRKSRFPKEEVWDQFALISRALDARGFLDGPCVLVHGDLEAYNILVAVNNSGVEITGVVDWDSAMFAPEVMAYRAPFWMWTPDDLDEYDVYPPPSDECKAARVPETEDEHTLKNAFLATSCTKYRKLAFSPEAILARRMMQILYNGLHEDWDCKETIRIVREWIVLHPEDGLRPITYWQDAGT